jgi:hypothetical protein
MRFKIKHISNFSEVNFWGNGYCHGGFHRKDGLVYYLEYFKNWIGLFNPRKGFLWTVGPINLEIAKKHFYLDLKLPTYITSNPNDDSILVSSSGSNKIFKIFPDEEKTELFIDTGLLGFKNPGNCEFDHDGNLWINDITGYKIWKFNSQGEVKLVLGNGKPGFQIHPISFKDVQFNWIYDIRIGPNGNIYILDSKNFSLRMIDESDEKVKVILGNGKPGYDGDNMDALNATLGSKPGVKFDGPYALSIDEEGNIYIGDTQNCVLRMIDKKTNLVSTIAGKYNCAPGLRNNPQETNPLNLNLPLISSLDYYNKQLFIPDMNWDLIVLEAIN